MKVDERIFDNQRVISIANEVGLNTIIGKLMFQNSVTRNALVHVTISALQKLALSDPSKFDNICPAETDSISEIDGLGQILTNSGYILFDSILYSCKLANFDLLGIHLEDAKTIRERSKNAQRQARHRLKVKNSVTRNADDRYALRSNDEMVNDKPKVKRHRRNDYTAEFEAFWGFALEQYKKVGSAPGNKREAFTAFQAADPSPENVERWTDALGAQARAKAKQGQRALSFKHVSRWLKYECWADVIQLPTRDSASARMGGFDQVDYTTGLEQFS